MPNVGNQFEISNFLNAVRDGDLDLVKEYLEKEKVSVNDSLEMPVDDIPATITALMLAAAYGHATLVDYLLTLPNIDVLKRSDEGYDAFAYTLVSDFNTEAWPTMLDQIAFAILNAIKDPEQRTKVILMDEHNVTETPVLLYAAEKNMLQTVIRLVREFGVPYNIVFDPLKTKVKNFTFSNGANPLEAAIAHGYTALIKLFVNGYIIKNLPQTVGIDFKPMEKIIIGEGIKIEPEHIEVALATSIPPGVCEYLLNELNPQASMLYLFNYAVDHCTSEDLFKLILQRLNEKEKRSIEVIALMKILNRKHTIIDANQTKTVFPTENGIIAREILRHMRSEQFANKDDVQQLIFMAVNSTPYFMQALLRGLKVIYNPESVRSMLNTARNGTTPAQYAVNRGRLETLPVLLHYGARLDGISHADCVFEDYAISFANPADSRKITTFHTTGTILHFAVLGKHVQLLQELLKLDAELLSKAACHQQLDMILDGDTGQTFLEFINQHSEAYAEILAILPQKVVPQPIDTKVAAEIEEDIPELAAMSPSTLGTTPNTATMPDSPEDEFTSKTKKQSLLWGCFGSSPASSATTTPNTTRSNTPNQTEPSTPATPITPGLSRFWPPLRRGTPTPDDNIRASTEANAGYPPQDRFSFKALV